MSRLVVQLPQDRDHCGLIELLSDKDERICGPFRVAGRSSSLLAAAHQNHTRFPLLPYGDTPVGNYVIRPRIATGKGTPLAKEEFGPHGALVLEGITGDAALADANGRFSFVVQGGELSAEGMLRSTAGGLRMDNADLRALIRAVERTSCKSCEIIETGDARGERVFDDNQSVLPDPLPLSTVHPQPKAAGGIHLPRKTTVLMAMGATFVVQNQANAEPVRAAFLPAPKIPIPRDIHFAPLDASAAAIGQAYNPPPEATQEATSPAATPEQAPSEASPQQASPETTQQQSLPETPQEQMPPAGAKCFDNCEGGSATQQLHSVTGGQINTGQLFENGGRAASDTTVTPNQQTATPSASTAVPSTGTVQGAPVRTPSQPQLQSPAPQQQQAPLSQVQQVEQNQQQNQQEYMQHIQQSLPPGTLTAPPAVKKHAEPPPPTPPAPEKKSDDFKVLPATPPKPERGS